MSPNDPPPTPRKLSPEAEASLRASLAARDQDAKNPVRVPPVEPLLAKWSARKNEIARGDNVIPFPAPSSQPHATAARASEPISPQSREKLSDLIRKLKSEKPPDAP